MKKVKVCCFCEKWASGGIEAFIYNILTHMQLNYVEVDIVATCIEDSIFTKPLLKLGVHFIQLSGKLRNPKNNNLFRKLIQNRNYDVIHFHLFQGLSFYYAKIAKQEGIKNRIVHSHGAGLRNSKTKFIKLILHDIGCKVWASSATDLWACSKQAADFLFHNLSHKAKIIPNGINIDSFLFSKEARNRIRKKLGIENKIVIGNVGRLSQEKNQSFLLDIFSNFVKKNKNSLLLIVGDGEFKRVLIDKAKKLHIEKNVIFYGMASNIGELLSTMDIFVFPSFVEGLGIACIEAQVSGLPILCSDCVPNEAKITQNIKVMSLNDGANVWANELKFMLKDTHRQSNAKLVQNAGYNITDVAKFVETRYRESIDD